MSELASARPALDAIMGALFHVDGAPPRRPDFRRDPLALGSAKGNCERRLSDHDSDSFYAGRDRALWLCNGAISLGCPRHQVLVGHVARATSPTRKRALMLAPT